ncbi:hypothetical protein QUA82_07465 [Microcoleus sp. F8-D3]
MNRRKFIQYSALGSASFIVNLGLHNPQKADAFLFLLANPLLRLVLGGLGRGAFSYFQQRNQEWFDKRLEVQLAQREFLERQFTNVAVAEVRSPQYTVVVGSERRESLGKNAVLAFPRIEYDRPTMSAFSGAASIGMSIAAMYLRENQRLSIDEVQASVLPRVGGGASYADWRNWDSTSFRYYPNNYSDTGVRIRYDAVEPRRGGFGIIEVAVDAFRPIAIPQIRVNYA